VAVLCSFHGIVKDVCGLPRAFEYAIWQSALVRRPRRHRMLHGRYLAYCVVSGRRSVIGCGLSRRLYVYVILIDRGCTGGVLQQRSRCLWHVNNAAAPA
jgi:hypothetical protein